MRLSSSLWFSFDFLIEWFKYRPVVRCGNGGLTNLQKVSTHVSLRNPRRAGWHESKLFEVFNFWACYLGSYHTISIHPYQIRVWYWMVLHGDALRPVLPERGSNAFWTSFLLALGSHCYMIDKIQVCTVITKLTVYKQVCISPFRKLPTTPSCQSQCVCRSVRPSINL